MSNSRDLMSIIELAEHKEILQNSKYKSLLENVLFDILEVGPFTEASLSQGSNTVSFMSDMIRKFVKPL